ncbi:Protein kinase C [Formica fusca]
MRLQNPAEDFVPDTKDTIDEALMLKGSLSPYLDTHNEEESSYVTLSNGPYAYAADSTSAEHNSYNHILVDVYFVTPILCKHCEDYIWGTGKVGTKCKVVPRFSGRY